MPEEKDIKEIVSQMLKRIDLKTSLEGLARMAMADEDLFLENYLSDPEAPAHDQLIKVKFKVLDSEAWLNVEAWCAGRRVSTIFRFNPDRRCWALMRANRVFMNLKEDFKLELFELVFKGDHISEEYQADVEKIKPAMDQSNLEELVAWILASELEAS